jgi:hypothetical protein
METEEARRRPIGITVLAAFYLLAAPLTLFLGFTFIGLLSVGGASSGPLSLEGLLRMYYILFSPAVFAIALIVVAVGLLLGKKWARSGTVVLCLANLAFACFLYASFSGMNSGYPTTILLIDALIQLAIIYYVYTPTAKLYLRAGIEESVLGRWKGVFLVLGLVLLVAGAPLIMASSVTVQPRVVYAESIETTVTNERYYSSLFGADEGDTIEFRLTATGKSVLQLRINDHPHDDPLTKNSIVYTADHRDDASAALQGVNYTDRVLINVTGGYYVEFENWAGHYESGSGGSDPVFVYDDSGNTYSGNLYLWRVPVQYPSVPLLTIGGAFLAASCGLLLIPTSAYLRSKTKHSGVLLS